MGMPITVEIVNLPEVEGVFDSVFDFFWKVDQKFSTYKSDSEISRINRGELDWENISPEMKEVFELSDRTKKETNGYFDILTPQKIFDPSGLVKGWAINRAADMMRNLGCRNFYINAGGDVQTSGSNAEGRPWSVGIRNPFNNSEIIKAVFISGEGVATSGTYVRGQHIYNPLNPREPITEIASLSVIGPNIYEADRFATAAFAMGKEGINFIERQPGLEGYMVDKNKMATMTGGFGKYTKIIDKI